MISAVFRRGGDISFVVEELKAVFDPRGGQWMHGKYVPSLLAALGGVVETHLIDIGFLRSSGEITDPGEIKVTMSKIDGTSEKELVYDRQDASQALFRQCPKCGHASLVRQEGCDTCMSCAYSKCG